VSLQALATDFEVHSSIYDPQQIEKNNMRRFLSHCLEILVKPYKALIITGFVGALGILRNIQGVFFPQWQAGQWIMNLIPDLPIVVWVIGIAVATVLIILVNAHRKLSEIEDAFEEYKREPPQMVELGKLHTSGVVLRNRGTRIKKEEFKEEFPVWQQEYEGWKRQVVDVVSQVSVSKAQRIETLNRIPESGVYSFPKAINTEHRRDLRTLEKRLEIVEKILNQYSGLD
jgi:hypothetical protein